MKNWLIIATLLSLTVPSYAQKIKVKRVKGNQAVVEFSGGTLENGRVYELNADEFGGTTTLPSDLSASRKYSISVGFRLSNSKSDATGAQNETDIQMSGRFGWNTGTIEFGPLGTYSYDQAGNITSTAFTVGGFADYNIIPNIPGEIFLYGLGGQGSFGQADNGAGTKQDLISVFVGPNVKWFPSGREFALRFDGGYEYKKLSSGNADATVTGLGLNVELMAYF